jgi:hypothetical protein
MKRIAIVLAAALHASYLVSPAAAQWTRIEAVPAVNLYEVWTHGDTIAAGSDSTAFVSFDAGASWIATAKVAAGVTQVQAVRVHDGRLYAGTLGQGVFVSSNRGTTWQSFNQGLVGGINNSQLFIMDLLLRGDTLYAATGGAGPWIRNLAAAGGWSRYGSVLEPAQAGNMEAIAASPTRLLAAAGFNGDVFYRDDGDADWTESLLFNDHLAAGLAPLAAVWTGSAWLVASNIGVFRGDPGQSPWTYFDFGLHPTLFASFAQHGGLVFTSFASGAGTGIEFTADHGVTWQVLDALPFTFTFNIATVGNVMYAGRVDGLWRRSIATVGVPPAGAPAGLRFALAGSNPVRDEARFRFELPAAARVRIDLFDLAGRRLAGGIDQALPAGPHEMTWQARDLAPGMYLARIHAAGRSEAVRLVRIR